MKKMHLIRNYAIRHHKQAGMTLIELTVVLLVLIGLAGLLIPYVSGFVSKTHDSTGTSNAARLNQTILQYEAQFWKQPNNMESLINGVAGAGAAPCDAVTATAGDSIYCKLMTTNFYTPVTLNATSANSLTSAGITSVLDNDPNTGDATFESVTGAPRDIVDTGVLAAVSPTPSAGITTTAQHLVQAFGGQETDYDATDGTFDGEDGCFDYVAFGVGEGNSMIGRSMSTAPIHFAQNADMGPTNNYNRFVAVYKVDSSNTAPCSTSTEKAKLVGTGMTMGAMSGHIWGVGASAAHAYSNIAADNNN